MIGQRRVQSALADLKGCSSISEVLWFGFGIQHPIRHLARTDNGYSCIALCRALSAISPDLEAAAVILTEFADIKGAPQYLRPSLQQWHDMLKSCSGSLITTKFECIANQYMLLSGTLGKVASATVGEPRDVALALDAIGRLSRGEIAAITLAAGAICGWLAAFAHVFLGLEIELQDSNKNPVMKTVAENKRVHVVVLFGETTSQEVQLSNTSYYIRDVGSLTKASYSLQSGRVPWDEAIKRTFGSLGIELLEARRSFGALIGSAARIFAAVAHHDKDLESYLKPRSNMENKIDFYRSWIGYNVESFGRGYVNFALGRLHELEELHDAIEPCLGYSVHQALTEYKDAALKLKKICSCESCKQGVIGAAPESSNCIYRLGEFIIILLWQLSVVDVSTMMQPTQRGLERIYYAWQYGSPSHSHRRYLDKYQHVGNIVPLLNYLDASTTYQATRCLFAGCDGGDLIYLSHLPGDQNVSKLFPALTTQGLCLFVDTLVEISDRPETRKFLHILPGTIEGPSGTHFAHVEDGETIDEYQKEELKPLENYASLEEVCKTPLESRLLARESLRNISASIHISGPKGYIHIGPMKLQRAIFGSFGLIQCSGRGCDPISVSAFSRIMVAEESSLVTEEHRTEGIVILRKLAGNTLARCVSVAMPSGPCVEFTRHRFPRPDLLLRRDECISCCIRAALSFQGDCSYVYITL